MTHSLLVLVRQIDGTPIYNASVRLEDGGYDETQNTSLCGQTLFSAGVSASDTYDLTVSAPGYTTENVIDFSINGETNITIILSP